MAGTADYWDWWSGLDEAARDGKSVAHHEALPDDPYWRRYIYGQLDLARLSAGEVARKVRLPAGARSLLDIGGGHGWYSVQLCRRHPRLTATVLDLPGSAAIGREIVAGAGMAARVTYRDGDAITADLGGGYDAVLCFNLLHHLEPGQIVSLFGKIREALNPGGMLAILDVFAEPGHRASAHADLLALFVYLSSGATVHTPGALDTWLRGAGFTRPRGSRCFASRACRCGSRPDQADTGPLLITGAARPAAARPRSLLAAGATAMSTACPVRGADGSRGRTVRGRAGLPRSARRARGQAGDARRRGASSRRAPAGLPAPGTPARGRPPPGLPAGWWRAPERSRRSRRA